jgi:hypothetical protein
MLTIMFCIVASLIGLVVTDVLPITALASHWFFVLILFIGGTTFLGSAFEART